MEIPDELAIIHHPSRLRIMALLHEHGDVAAGAARAALQMTAGNLESHARRLAAEGLLDGRRLLGAGGFEARYRITRAGLEAFRNYLALLEAFVLSQRQN